MKIVKPVLISFSLLAFASASAYAAKEDFSKLDKDGDGSIGRIEAAADADAKSRFERLDANGDQKLSPQEYDSWKSAAGQVQQGRMQVSKLIGAKVTGAKGEDLGEINDVVIDLQGRKVHAAVLEFGGTLGMGEKNYAFPISQLKSGKGDKLALNVQKEKLKDAEGFAQGQWPAMDDEYWGRVGGQASAGASKGQAQKKMQLVRASELIGKNVQDKSGNDAGEIKDIMVNLGSGELRNIVIDVNDGGQATVQAKALTKGTGDKIVLNMSAEQLKSQAKNGK